MRPTGYLSATAGQELCRFTMLSATVRWPVLKHMKRRMLRGSLIRFRFK